MRARDRMGCRIKGGAESEYITEGRDIEVRAGPRD